MAAAGKGPVVQAPCPAAVGGCRPNLVCARQTPQRVLAIAVPGQFTFVVP